jgi:hypothetical protein
MIGRSLNACATHQAALLDFAERLERTAGTAAALAHLERCRRCEDELAGIVRTIAGLRRMADAVARVEPGQETWPLLRERVTRREPSTWRGHQSLGGLMAMAVVALFVLPSIGGGPMVTPTSPTEAPGQTLVQDRYYESPAGPLTAEMVNAIAGQDLSKRARLRSAIFRMAPSSVDRDERNPTSSRLFDAGDGAGMPVAIARS